MGLRKACEQLKRWHQMDFQESGSGQSLNVQFRQKFGQYGNGDFKRDRLETGTS